jgi:hypothetical protein
MYIFDNTRINKIELFLSIHTHIDNQPTNQPTNQYAIDTDTGLSPTAYTHKIPV